MNRVPFLVLRGLQENPNPKTRGKRAYDVREWHDVCLWGLGFRVQGLGVLLIIVYFPINRVWADRVSRLAGLTGLKGFIYALRAYKV